MVRKPQKLTYFRPRTSRANLQWPSLPKPNDAAILALQYQFEGSEWLPPHQIEYLQMRQAAQLIAHARAQAPFYKDRLAMLDKVGKRDFSCEQFRQIPVLTREDIQNAKDDLFAQKTPRDHGKVITTSSSGSTGRPISIRMTALAGTFFSALTLRYHNWHRRDFMAKTCAIKRLTDAQKAEAEKGGALPWVPAYASGPMRQMDSNKTPEEHLKWLIDERPEYLLIYPNILTALLELCRENGTRPEGLRHVTTFGEVVEPGLRQLCREAWNVPIVDSYSSMECGLIAIQCPQNEHYHVQSENVIVEILKEDGTPCSPGETGRVIITDLHNFATPLIRYEIGDYATAGGKCSCGRGLPILSHIQGRARDMLTRPDGSRVWFSPYFNIDFPMAFRQMQILQRSSDDLEILLQSTEPLNPAQTEKLKGEILRNIGTDFQISLTYVDDIPRQENGKFMDFKVEFWDADNKKPGI